MKTVLLAGFEPFADDTLNPSWEAVRALDGVMLPQGQGQGAGAGVADGADAADATHGARIVAARLPCVFDAVGEALSALLAQHQPALAIAVGLAGGRAEMSIERVAINLDDARIADNAGRQPIDTTIVERGPAAYFSTLPIKSIAHGLRQAGIPASVSQTAGTFVCNHAFYWLQHSLAAANAGRDAPVKSGFIHVPWLPEQIAQHPGQPSMALETIVAGLRLAVQIALRQAQDLRQTGGAEH